MLRYKISFDAFGVLSTAGKTRFYCSKLDLQSSIVNLPDRSPIRQMPLAQQVQKILMDQIKAGVYPIGAQLPPEEDLAGKLGVSRTTVRGALDGPVARGIVIRRHGAGTFVSPFSRIRNPLDDTIDFQALIREFRFEPGVQYIYSSIEGTTAALAQELQIEPDAQVLESHKIFTADGKPVIYCVNTIPIWMFDNNFLEEVRNNPAAIEPLYTVLEQRCKQRIEYYFSKMRPALSENCKFHGGLPLAPGTPILAIDEIAYTANGRPLLHTFEYSPETQMTYELVRRRGSRR